MIRGLAAERGSVAAAELVARTGLTRQAVHFHVKDLVRRGELEPRGAGRGAHYVRTALFDRTYETKGLEEDRVWRETSARVRSVRALRENVRSIVQYAFTEMLNNAIDHSSSAEVRVRLWTAAQRLAFTIHDGGVGAFAHVRRKFDLPDDFAALESISKGKTTTLPDRHSGEGIFFTSKAVDLFVLEANGLRWTVDNERNDEAVGDTVVHAGTLVRCEIDQASSRSLADVFAQYTATDDLAFSRSKVSVRLFQKGDHFVSRSEAKRIAQGLERFEEVVVDFEGIREIGQGFADELFRVWQHDHPKTQLVAVNASPPVKRMIDRISA